MDSQGQAETKYHVVLIGIDDYKVRPLSGCVNDIDTVQRVLLGDRMGIPAGSIRRLASPRPWRSWTSGRRSHRNGPTERRANRPRACRESQGCGASWKP